MEGPFSVVEEEPSRDGVGSIERPGARSALKVAASGASTGGGPWAAWWLPWVCAGVVLAGATLLPRVVPELGAVRAQMAAQRCREQMLSLAAGELQHYLDHRAFTTEQLALARYVPIAERARCPSCGRPYSLEILRDRARVTCPCKDVRHGWVDQPVPAAFDSSQGTGGDTQ